MVDRVDKAFFNKFGQYSDEKYLERNQNFRPQCKET